VLVEEYLDGPEVSLFCLTDGVTTRALLPAQDFKRVGDGDAGPNTGGMGAYTPLPWAPEHLVDEVLDRVVHPTVDEMRARGTDFAGLLYVGLALTSRGLRVVEFNARFGDPETQPVLALQRAPLGTLLHAAATGTLHAVEPPTWRHACAVSVVVAAEGYPAAPRLGDVINGVEAADALEGVRVLHSGTARDAEGRLVTAGGRVLSVTAVGETLAHARDRAYEGVALIDIPGMHYRRDIALQAAAGA
jgi:phosphoribosylamine--glycine ligase